MTESKWRTMLQPTTVVPGVIFGVGCFAVYVLSLVVQGPLAQQLLPTTSGLLVGALTVATFARVRDAYVVAAAVYSASACIIATLAIPAAMRFGVSALCVGTVLACVVAYLSLPVGMPVEVRVDERDRR